METNTAVIQSIKSSIDCIGTLNNYQVDKNRIIIFNATLAFLKSNNDKFKIKTIEIIDNLIKFDKIHFFLSNFIIDAINL